MAVKLEDRKPIIEILAANARKSPTSANGAFFFAIMMS